MPGTGQQEAAGPVGCGSKLGGADGSVSPANALEVAGFLQQFHFCLCLTADLGPEIPS